jgi:hypothetical protein
VRSVILTDDELVILDGRCAAKVQAEVDAAKLRVAMSTAIPGLKPELAGLIADIVTEAQQNGRLVFQHTGIDRCPICKRTGGYAKWRSTTRYHRKGDENKDKPLSIGAYDFARRFITWSRSVTLGCCDTCFAEMKPALLAKLSDVRAAIPDALTGVKPKWIRYDNRKCTNCNWTGHEGEMVQDYALMGGKYTAGCPQCGEKNRPFGRTIIATADGFSLIEAPAPEERE